MSAPIQTSELDSDAEYQAWLADPDAQLEYQIWATVEDFKSLLKETS
jgi:hypothetical protein